MLNMVKKKKPTKHQWPANNESLSLCLLFNIFIIHLFKGNISLFFQPGNYIISQWKAEVVFTVHVGLCLILQELITCGRLRKGLLRLGPRGAPTLYQFSKSGDFTAWLNTSYSEWTFIKLLSVMRQARNQRSQKT